jgi:hypothetical protein
MSLAEFAVVHAANEEDDIFIQCFDDAELVVVSISRTSLDDYFQWPGARGRRPSAPQCRLVVDRNLDVLKPVIEDKYRRREFGTLNRAGSSLKHIVLTGSDLGRVSAPLTDSVLDVAHRFV